MTEKTIAFIDNPLAPDVYVDDAVGCVAHNGTIRITLVSDRAAHTTPSGPINRVVVGRLVMTVPAAQALATGLFNFLKSQGVAPAAVDSGKPMRAH